MKVIFSRKGFDSTAGKAPSPIIDGEPISLPIPTEGRSETTYELAGCGQLVEEITKGRVGAGDLCHEDPVFLNGRWVFGQTGAAQSHLERNGVGPGDVFLFFGLFALHGGRDRHHRIFGYMQVEEVRRLGTQPSDSDSPEGFPRRHPHTIGEWNGNNTLYLGAGAKAKTAHPCLRLTKLGAPASIWTVPEWLNVAGLTYHANADRWAGKTELCAASRGQEFVSDIGNYSAARRWLESLEVAIRQGGER
jgi:Nucleotide modification associated domain 3